LNNELQNIVSGKGAVGSESIIHAAAGYLTASQTAGRKTEPDEFTKEQEATQFIKFKTKYRLWYPLLAQANKNCCIANAPWLYSNPICIF
jgi:hypothetical protein